VVCNQKDSVVNMSATTESEPPTSPELVPDEGNIEVAEPTEEELNAKVEDVSSTTLNVAHLSEADRSALYASLMPPSIQQPADIQKVCACFSRGVVQ
jgi:rRNA maturation endonuclease Nob1